MNHILQTAVGGLSIGAVYALVALGFSIVFRTMGLVNFGHADILMVGAFLTATFYIDAPSSVRDCADLRDSCDRRRNGIRLRARPPAARAHATSTSCSSGRSASASSCRAPRCSSGGPSGQRRPTPITDTPIDVGGIVIRAYDLLVLGTATAVMVSLYLFLNHTKRGAAMQAAAMDYDAATAVGINVRELQRSSVRHRRRHGRDRRRRSSGPCVYVSVGMGGSIGIRGFAAAILGGFGNIPGAIVGGLALGLIQSFAQGSDYGAYTERHHVRHLHGADHDPADWAARRADGVEAVTGCVSVARRWRSWPALAFLPFVLTHLRRTHREPRADLS